MLTASDRVIFAEAEELALQRQFEQAEQRFEVGLTAITDVHEARASYDNARARAIVARNQLADAREGLRQLTGQYFEEVDPLQEELAACCARTRTTWKSGWTSLCKPIRL